MRPNSKQFEAMQRMLREKEEQKRLEIKKAIQRLTALLNQPVVAAQR